MPRNYNRNYDNNDEEYNNIRSIRRTNRSRSPEGSDNSDNDEDAIYRRRVTKNNNNSNNNNKYRYDNDNSDNDDYEDNRPIQEQRRNKYSDNYNNDNDRRIKRQSSDTQSFVPRTLQPSENNKVRSSAPNPTSAWHDIRKDSWAEKENSRVDDQPSKPKPWVRATETSDRSFPAKKTLHSSYQDNDNTSFSPVETYEPPVRRNKPRPPPKSEYQPNKRYDSDDDNDNDDVLDKQQENEDRYHQHHQQREQGLNRRNQRDNSPNDDDDDLDNNYNSHNNNSNNNNGNNKYYSSRNQTPLSDAHEVDDNDSSSHNTTTTTTDGPDDDCLTPPQTKLNIKNLESHAFPTPHHSNHNGIPSGMKYGLPFTVPFIHFCPLNGEGTPMVQCLIVRDREDIGSKLYPSYSLYLEKKNKLLLIAKKMSFNSTSNYHLFDMSRGSVNTSKMNKKSGNYLGKLRAADSNRTEYTIVTAAKERKEIGAIAFDRNGLVSQIKEGCQPRKMYVLLPEVSDENTPVEHAVTKSIGKKEITMIDQLRLSDPNKIYSSKDPVFERGNYRLNFNGRVTMASVKNFQLASPSDPDNVICQFGKIADDKFHLDYKAPLNVFQAFCLALCHFDT